jgi:hypothetical protein
MMKANVNGNRVLAIGLTAGLMVVGLVLVGSSQMVSSGKVAEAMAALGWCCMVAGAGALALWQLTRRS